MVVRLLLIVGLLLATMLLPLWAMILIMLGYVLRYPALELIPLMVLVDGYYGVLGHQPLLTLCAVLLVGAAALLKPFLSVYTHTI